MPATVRNDQPEILLDDYPVLKELCWNWHLPSIRPDEALRVYEEQLAYIDPATLKEGEKNLINMLATHYRSYLRV